MREQGSLFDTTPPSKLDSKKVVTPTTSYTPLAYQLAPNSLDDYIGQDHLLGDEKPLRKALESDHLLSMILWGPPGCGKTSLAKLVSTLTKAHFIPLNAVTAKIQDIKDAAKQATEIKQLGKRTILFIDEIHRFSKTQQDALLPHVESGLFTFMGATTENPFFSVIPPLISRARVFELSPLSENHLSELLERGIQTLSQTKPISLDESAKAFLLSQCRGDARTLFNLLEWAWNGVHSEGSVIDQNALEALTQTKGIPHSADSHYDMASALIKSLRGSDPDAAIYWLARLLKGGEDPEFIARRLIIFASEDIGNADPSALPLATALLNATKFIGMPEVRINLGHVVTYLASAPKSNAAYVAINKALAYVDEGHIQPVPNHLRDGGTKAKKELGFGKGYKYPHNFEGGWVQQDYTVDPIPTFYEPKNIGFEKNIRSQKPTPQK